MPPRTLEDVMFSLPIVANRRYHYDISGNTRALEIERAVQDRLLDEMIAMKAAGHTLPVVVHTEPTPPPDDEKELAGVTG